MHAAGAHTDYLERYEDIIVARGPLLEDAFARTQPYEGPDSSLA